MSDISLFPLGLNLAVPNEDDQQPENPMLHIVVQSGTILPIDTGGGQGLPIPLDTYRIPVPRDLAIEFGEKIKEAAESLPEPVEKPDIILADNLNEQNLQAAQRVEQTIREGR